MAANLSRPDDIESNEQSVKTTCSCSNISIMQLFHEMKQEFPTVPDNIVLELVADNCHNRLGCIKNLKRAAIGHPISAQAYPSQSIHNSTSNSKATTNEIRRNSESKTFSSTQNKNNDIQDHSNQNMISKISDSVKNFSFMKKESNTNNNVNNINTSNSNVNNRDQNNVLQRPTTLTLSNIPNNNFDANEKLSRIIHNQNKPTRIAPPPPPSLTPGQLQLQYQLDQLPHLQLQQQQQEHQQQLSHPLQPSLPHTQTPKPSDDDAECLNVSLNVTVSPISGKPPLRPPRLTSALLVQPEPSYPVRDANPINPRSYTSVNFTLRQPSTNPQSPINISAGPGLTYSSSSFDAKQGYQSSLQITVGGSGCSSISAMRTRSNTGSSSSPTATTPSINSISDSTIDSEIVINAAKSTTVSTINSKSHFINQDNMDDDLIVKRQIEQKSRLDLELNNDKLRLEKMQRDVYALGIPISSNSAIVLQEEIKRLRCECERMSNELDAAGVAVLGDISTTMASSSNDINDASDNNAIIQQPIRSPKPPRPPPPAYVQRNLSGHSPTTANNNLLSRQHDQSPIFAEQQNLYNPSLNNNINDSNNNYNAEGPPWTCNMCTFRNHPLLNKCEQCEMPRISGTIQITSTQFTPPQFQKINYQKSSSSTSLSSLNSNHYSTLTPDHLFIPSAGQNHNNFRANNPIITMPCNSTSNNNNILLNNERDPLIYAMTPLSMIAPVVPANSSFNKTHRHTPSM